MASYRGHLMFSTALGAAYGGVAVWQLGYDWASAALGGGLTALGGLLPDLDSDSGVPVRELFGLAATLTPLLLLQRFTSQGWTGEEILVILAIVYLFIRYGLSELFKRVTVHRGMFHSVPAMLIAGLLVFLAYHHPSTSLRLYLACGVMIGFLSHLVLDELCSVNMAGVGIRLNKYAGSALKLGSASWTATLITYALLGGLTYVASIEYQGTPADWNTVKQRTLTILSKRDFLKSSR